MKRRVEAKIKVFVFEPLEMDADSILDIGDFSREEAENFLSAIQGMAPISISGYPKWFSPFYDVVADVWILANLGCCQFEVIELMEHEAFKKEPQDESVLFEPRLIIPEEAKPYLDGVGAKDEKIFAAEATDGYEGPCKIWVSHEYFLGEIDAPNNAYLADQAGNVIIFESFDKAQKWRDNASTKWRDNASTKWRDNASTSKLQNGEVWGPTYIICKA